jgi:hypothetical protein
VNEARGRSTSKFASSWGTGPTSVSVHQTAGRVP